jgi:hypothetical protein
MADITNSFTLLRSPSQNSDESFLSFPDDSDKENQTPTIPEDEQWLPVDDTTRWESTPAVSEVEESFDVDLSKKPIEGVKLTFEAFIHFNDSNDRTAALLALFEDVKEPCKGDVLLPLLQLFWASIQNAVDHQELRTSIIFAQKRLERLGIDAREYSGLVQNSAFPRLSQTFQDYSSYAFGTAQHLGFDVSFAGTVNSRVVYHSRRIFELLQECGLEKFGGPVFVHYGYLPISRWDMTNEEWQAEGRRLAEVNHTVEAV